MENEIKIIERERRFRILKYFCKHIMQKKKMLDMILYLIFINHISVRCNDSISGLVEIRRVI